MTDATIVNVALPSVITDLPASLDQAIWAVNAYLLVFTALLILAGRLGEIFGPRRLFIVGLALFAVAPALCGVSQTPGQLIRARLLQGIGAAALTPQAMVIIQAPACCCGAPRLPWPATSRPSARRRARRKPCQLGRLIPRNRMAPIVASPQSHASLG